MYTKQPKGQKRCGNTKNSNHTLPRAKPIHKVQHGQRTIPYKHSNSLYKDIKERMFNYLVHFFTIFKSYPISLPPNSPKQIQWSTFQAFFPLFSYKGPLSTQKSTPNWRMQHPLHTKKSINQMSQKDYFQAMKENMVNNFFLYTHVTSIWNLPTLLFELIQS